MSRPRPASGATRRWLPRTAGLLLPLALSLLAPVAAAQPSPEPRSTHRRAGADGGAVLRERGVRLYLPPGAVAPGAIVGLGAGGVPAPDGSLARSGAIVSAAGGLRTPGALLFAPTAADQAALADGTPALLDLADGSRAACAAFPPWIACPVRRPGAYLLDSDAGAPSPDPLLGEAVAAAGGAARASPSRLRGAAIVLLAALAAGAGVWLLSGRPSAERPDGAAGSGQNGRPGGRPGA